MSSGCCSLCLGIFRWCAGIATGILYLIGGLNYFFRVDSSDIYVTFILSPLGALLVVKHTHIAIRRVTEERFKTSPLVIMLCTACQAVWCTCHIIWLRYIITTRSSQQHVVRTFFLCCIATFLVMTISAIRFCLMLLAKLDWDEFEDYFDTDQPHQHQLALSI